ncbi:YHS domain-containing (seleno)protein [Marinobacter sp. F3R08]|uniref:YHS domain-containing (seleno)protein n=1 Tax=Marinobacter sp. F3R08 TaxID=2841559 RepID=UPI001C09A7D0|nr:YHS domain-containing (seleno)protein [Marinobacter sp. F3R08]MBU2955943.1 hypothetical protein [Marinobacter sp. F3R08]
MIRFKKLRALVAVASIGAAAVSAADLDMNANANDVAISGYDPVAYFSESEATKGSVQYTATYKNAIYHFSSEEHRDLFRADPGAYAPQYGGYCAFGVTKEKKFDVDPEAWRIVDNKLYLNLNKDIQKHWLRDVPGYIATANDIWPDIKTVEAAEL